jgi:DNA-binding CsgD family transcriptional regulator
MNHLEHGRECYARRASGDAYQTLQRADEETQLLDDLERLATAACLSGREAEFLRILERQYRVHEESGDHVPTGVCAGPRARVDLRLFVRLRSTAGDGRVQLEIQVLRLISSGRTNKEIAGTLCLSVRTIDRDVSNILDKLDVPSRAGAAVHAVRHNFL